MRDLFDYISPNRGIMQSVRKVISKYLDEQYIWTPGDFNDLDRLDVVRRYFQENGTTLKEVYKIGSVKSICDSQGYNLERHVPIDQFVSDLKSYIDLRLPVLYFKQINGWSGTAWQNKKHKYPGIDKLAGLIFHDPENYRREQSRLTSKKITNGISYTLSDNTNCLAVDIPMVVENFEPSNQLHLCIDAMKKLIMPKIHSSFFNEENVKNNLIVDLLRQGLGYPAFSDVLNWESHAGFKGNQRADCIISKDNNPHCIIEVKNIKENLGTDKNMGQLKNYFASKHELKLAIHTNGQEFRFYTDGIRQNLMDEIPFHQFNIFNMTDEDYNVLEMFSYRNLMDNQFSVAKKYADSVMENQQALEMRYHASQELKSLMAMQGIQLNSALRTLLN